MEGVLKTEAIRNFLRARTHPDLSALYTPNMEVQVIVAQDQGESKEKEYKGRKYATWTDGVQEWKPIRIPFDSAGNPYYEDSPISFNLDEHAEGIGLTGYDWVERCSRYVGYDFDAITGHSERHVKKLTNQELTHIQETLFGVEWATVRYSTSGKGRHIYVFLDPPVATANHTEHAALARSILGQLSASVGFDFFSKVDALGGILWVWHRKMEGQGLTLIRQGGSLGNIPPNWRDHIPVIKGQAKKTTPFIIKDNQEEFEDISKKQSPIPLDAEHLRILNWITDKGYRSWYDADRHMLVTHTWILAQAHEELGLKGIFKTLATGSEAGSDINAFCFPTPRGGFVVRRFSLGVAEAESWFTDVNGWTKTYFNCAPNFEMACRACGGQLDDRGRYVFNETEFALHALHLIQVNINPAQYTLGRKCVLKKNRDGKLIIDIDRVEGDSPRDMKDWIIPDGRKRLWQKVITLPTQNDYIETDVQSFDDVVRYLVTEDGNSYGWVTFGEGQWRRGPSENTRFVLAARGQESKNIPAIMGQCVEKAWTIINRPFEEEYPAGRCWNKDAVQFAFPPNKSENRSFPHWMKILTHIGANLTPAVQNDPWCQEYSIFTGADYLKCWIASVVQYPLRHLPYLFIYGPENSGKTVIQESLQMLFTRGAVARADRALLSQGGFNAEIEHAILCAIEEVNLSKGDDPYLRMKDWTTAKEISIHPKGKTPYLQPNSAHFIHCANDPSFCPVSLGDTRVVMIRVDPFENGEAIPRNKFDELLFKEAADFLGELVSLELPESNDRLNIPPVTTEEKLDAQEVNATTLQLFLKENLFPIPGHRIPLREIKDRFHKAIPPHERMAWEERKIAGSLPSPYQRGHDRSTNYVYVINASWDQGAEPKPKYVIRRIKDRNIIFNENEDHEQGSQ